MPVNKLQRKRVILPFVFENLPRYCTLWNPSCLCMAVVAAAEAPQLSRYAPIKVAGPKNRSTSKPA